VAQPDPEARLEAEGVLLLALADALDERRLAHHVHDENNHADQRDRGEERPEPGRQRLGATTRSGTLVRRGAAGAAGPREEEAEDPEVLVGPEQLPGLLDDREDVHRGS
jgi:hypothetical protein